MSILADEIRQYQTEIIALRKRKQELIADRVKLRGALRWYGSKVAEAARVKTLREQSLDPDHALLAQRQLNLDAGRHAVAVLKATRKG